MTAKPKPSGGTHWVRGSLPINQSLHGKLTAEFYEPLKRKELLVYHGPKPMKKGPNSYITDEQVLAIRKMRHWLGMFERDIALLTGIPQNTIHGLAIYRNRVHLDPGPTPQDLPSISDLLGAINASTDAENTD
jgi:hypothetical protein